MVGRKSSLLQTDGSSKSMECYGVVRSSKWLFNWILLFWRKSWQTHLLRIVKGPFTWTIGERWLSNKKKDVALTRWCSATFCTHRTWIFELKFQWEMDWARRFIRIASPLTRCKITWFFFMGLYKKCSFCLATHNKRRSDEKNS